MSDTSRGSEPTGRGAARAAALLLGLGPEVAAAVFRELGETEVRRIAVGARELRKAPPAAVPDALGAFVESMERVGGDAAAGDDLLREVAEKVLGHDAAQRAFDGIAAPRPPDEFLGPIAEADPESLAMVLGREQAQTVALVLSALSPEKAAAVMEHIPEAQRAQIIRRMATVESVAPEVLREVRHALTQELQAVVAEGMKRVDGKKAALEMLRRAPSAQQAEVLAAIEKDDATLGADLRTKLFTFDDLSRLTDRDVQALLKDVDQSQLSMALKGASPELREKFLRNMSTRASQMLSDDLAAMGPVRVSLVEAAQATIAKAALEASDKGRITIVRPTDKML
jgi:flagellar motor switch protein FliG